MLTLPSSVRVFMAVTPVDMRGSFDALAGQVRRMALDPQLCGALQYVAPSTLFG